MNFISPLPRGRQQGFAEGANIPGVSVRDDRTVGNQWRKAAQTDAQSNAVLQSLAKMQTDINRIRRRVLGAIQPSTLLRHPFQIYAASQNTLSRFVGQTAQMFTGASTGIPVACTIVASGVPTDLTAMPPVVSIDDAWRFFYVRSGLVEYRPIYSQEIGLPQTVPDDPNNWGLKSFSGNGINNFILNTDGIGAWNTDTSFDNGTITSGQTPLIVGINPDGTHPTTITLWINITPDTIGALAIFQIYGIANNLTALSPSYGFPSGPYAIPIGEAYFDVNNVLNPYQLVFDHINNRYPSGNGNFNMAQGCMMNFRGLIQGNEQPASGTSAVLSPTDLNKQLFYPGDIVIVQGYGDGWPSNAEQQAIYMFTGQSPAYDVRASQWLGWDYSDNGDTPLDGNLNWTQIFNLPIIPV